MEITDIQAHYLLFALDAYLNTNDDGRVTTDRNAYGKANWQALRDELFDAHEHPKETIGENWARGKERDEWKHEALEAMKLKR